MLNAASKALAQMFSRPFRMVLLKSIGLALVLIVLAAIGLNSLLVWLVTIAQDWATGALGVTTQIPARIIVWVLSIAAGLGVITGSVFLMPAVTALIGSFFVDEIAEEVERRHYPAEPIGRPLPLPRAVFEGIKTALLAMVVYLVAMPFLLFAGFGLVIFFLAAAFLLGREYFLLAAMRYRPPAEAKAMRKAHQSTVFLAGMAIAAFVSIPIVNLATPLFAMAFMVHMHQRLSSGPRAELLERTF